MLTQTGEFVDAGNNTHFNAASALVRNNEGTSEFYEDVHSAAQAVDANSQSILKSMYSTGQGVE